MAESNKPETKFRAGGCTATVWKNTKEVKGRDVEFYSVTFERSYKDGEEWKTTNSLGQNDIPKACVVLNKAFEYIVLKQTGDE